MKLSATIFLIYIAVLIAHPLVKELYSSFSSGSESECTSTNCHLTSVNNKSESEKKSDPKNCCEEGVCNPFEECSCCMITIIDHPAFELNSGTISKVDFPLINAGILPSFYRDCFQPPEIV